MAAPAVERVPVDPFQAQFLSLQRQGRITETELARRLGWVCKGRPDGTRVMRLIGLREHYQRTGRSTRQTTVRYDLAVQLCEALEMDPVDGGV